MTSCFSAKGPLVLFWQCDTQFGALASFRNGLISQGAKKGSFTSKKWCCIFFAIQSPKLLVIKNEHLRQLQFLFPLVGKGVGGQIFEQSAYASFSSHMVWFQVSHFSKIRRTWCLHYLLLRFTVMLGNILPLTGLCVVWYLIIKARGDVFCSEISRDVDSNDDTFSNGYCGNCSSFGAEVDEDHTGRCKCKEGFPSDSLFLRSERRCKSGVLFKSKWTVFIWTLLWQQVCSISICPSLFHLVFTSVERWRRKLSSKNI